MQTAMNAVNGQVCPKKVPACNNDAIVTYISTRCYTPLATSVVEHIITNKNLSETARLYYLLADMYAQYQGKISSKREVTFAGITWSKLLGVSENHVFQLQRTLEQQGYFKIIRNRDYDNQNEINVIKPTLPEAVFKTLAATSNRTSAVEPTSDNEREVLDNSKMFISFNRTMVELLIRDPSITPMQKLIWLNFFMRAEFAFKASGDRRVSITISELASTFKCSAGTCSKALTNLEQQGYINKNIFKDFHKDRPSNRRKKTVYFIEAVLPEATMQQLFSQKRRSLNLDQDTSNLYDSIEQNYMFPKVGADVSQIDPNVSQIDPLVSQTGYSNNKYITTNKNNKYNNNKLEPTAVIDVDKNNYISQEHETSSNPEVTSQDLEDVDIAEVKHKQNLQKLTPEQNKKINNFAKKLKRENLLAENLRDISEMELIRQFVHHAANFKPTKINCQSPNDVVNAALNFAFFAAKQGTWSCPVGWGKAIDFHLQREKLRYSDDFKEKMKFKLQLKQYLKI